MSEFVATPSIPGPIEMANNLTAVCKIGRHYNLDAEYCLYCAAKVVLGNWKFICTDCHESVATGYFSLPACWINELYCEMYGAFWKPDVSQGVCHNG